MSTMQQRVLAMLALAAASVFVVAVAQAESSAQPTKPAEIKTGYAPVNGLKMYYEIERCAELSRLIPSAQLAVIPDASHLSCWSVRV